MTISPSNRTKIVCTIGPACAEYRDIVALIRAGMDVARLNFSHGTHQSHRETIALIRRASRETGRPVGILQDLAGPKIRLGDLAAGEVILEAGQRVYLVHGEQQAGEELPVNYPGLAREVAVGERILLADGLVELLVEEAGGDRLACRVVNGGNLSSRKGVNLPTSELAVPAFTEKDAADLEVGLAEGVDFVALSFVRRHQDLAEASERINRAADPPLLIAKIEKPQAVEDFPAILAQVGGVMVARGDLGVEMPLEEVPLIQKKIIDLTRRTGKPVITATQMLRSMLTSPRPTRAEATDVVNAVLDGSDAVMLSDETAVGEYPVEAVRILNRLAGAAEPVISGRNLLGEEAVGMLPPTEAAISRAACHVANDVGAVAIVAGTTGGGSARLVARFRPRQPVVALTASQVTQRQLGLSWGVVPLLTRKIRYTDDLLKEASRALTENGLARPGDKIVVTAGSPVGVPGTTNLVKVVEI